MITKTQGEFLWGALIGGAIGAATALMLTPFSGAALRRGVTDRLHHLNGRERPVRQKATARKSSLKESFRATRSNGPKPNSSKAKSPRSKRAGTPSVHKAEGSSSHE